MTTIEFRELTATDLELVSGGMDKNYKYCGNGPAGAGTYPLYTKCGPTYGDLIQIVLDTVEKGKQIQQQYGGGSGGRPA